VPDLLHQNDEGRQTFALKTERSRLLSDLGEKRKQIDDDRSVVGDIAKAYSLVTGTSQTHRQEERIDELTDRIIARESTAPSGRPATTSLEERVIANPLPAVRTILAVGSSVLGFGLGHAVQGTYSRQGWKWTAIDVANIAGLNALSANCTNTSDSTTGDPGSKSTGLCDASLFTLFVGLIVSRVWQGIEIGRAASHTYSPYSVGAIPQDGGGSIIATWSW
jgi:hypothetical protein